ncbi:bifunctional DNA primase/polymerase [Nocardia abscessus]|uniref:bifunctional DNA primase/polymerase n=1 Tax=Nocardia abscessus TaxID=120957 RepID=UPI001892DCB0|nr:bifunctional DNA primase/polymerase [Nocardia abscessus]MBF6339812.1 bifunctional DNA primase/polymerase [Nocardia abscessus]
MVLLSAALDNAERGFHVFPLHPGTKVPAIKQWDRAATQDHSRIRAWWRRRPRDNVAVACGPSGLHVLDLDTNHGHTPPPEWRAARNGREVLVRLAAESGQPMPVPTYAVATPSGGVHLYYRAPRIPPLRNTIARLGWRIDSRGHGGYVVAAGSQLPEGPYRRLDDRAPILLPQWLTELLSPPAPPRVPRNAPVVVHPDAYVQAALVNQSARVHAAYPGIRHRTLLLAANSLGRLVGAGLLDHNQAHAVLSEAARIHLGVEGFTAAESDRTITDGLTYAARRTLAGTNP